MRGAERDHNVSQASALLCITIAPTILITCYPETNVLFKTHRTEDQDMREAIATIASYMASILRSPLDVGNALYHHSSLTAYGGRLPCAISIVSTVVA